MSAVLMFEQQLSTETCYSCGIVFAVPHYFKVKRLEDRQSFWCPNGHAQAYCKSSLEKLRAEMQAKIDAEASRAEFWRRDSEQLKKTLTETRSKLTRTQKRVGNGVCPCCKRSFTDLHRHMKSKHPSYAAEVA